MPQGIGYDPEVLKALAALQKATGIGAPRAPMLPQGPMEPPMGGDIMSDVLSKATGIGAAPPDMGSRFRNAITSILGALSGGSGVGAIAPAMPQMPTMTPPRGDIALPAPPMRTPTPNRQIEPDMSMNAESLDMLPQGPEESGGGMMMDQFKKEVGGLFEELPSSRVPGMPTETPNLPVPEQVMSTGQMEQAGMVAPRPTLSSFATNIMSGIMESLVPAVVSFAANRTNSPEVVQAWSTNEAMKLQRAENAMRTEIAQMQVLGDLLSAQRAEEQLELSRLNLQRGLAQDVINLQKEVAPNDPLTYIKSVQGMSNLWTTSGGDLETFLDMSKLPNAPLLDRLREDFFKAHAATALDPAAQSAASVRNPWAPGDPTQNFTLDEAAVILGHVSETGRILQPLGAVRPSDIVERVTRNSAGVETTSREPMATALGKVDVKQPSLGESTFSFVGTDPETEEPIINIINRRIGQTRLPGQRTPQFVDPLGRFLRDTMRDSLPPPGGMDSLSEAMEFLKANGIANPTPEQAQELLDRSK